MSESTCARCMREFIPGSAERIKRAQRVGNLVEAILAFPHVTLHMSYDARDTVYQITLFDPRLDTTSVYHAHDLDTALTQILSDLNGEYR